MRKQCDQYSLNGDWEFRQQNKGGWFPATVPGCNFTDLIDNDLIEDPFYKDNELQLQWIEQENWEYRHEFELTASQLESQQIELVAEGLDTFCDIYINGERIGDGENMFVGRRIACKDSLKVGTNLIHVVFRSPIKEVYPSYQQAGFVYPAENDKTEEKLSVYCRKAPCHFGWDWGPRFVTSGIWRDIYLDMIGVSKIDQVGFVQHELKEEFVNFSFQLDIRSFADFQGLLKITCDEAPELNRIKKVGFSEIQNEPEILYLNLDFSLKNPQFWWPNGLGEPCLYQFCFELFDDEILLHRVEERIGFRNIELVNKPDAMGESFFVKVNGHPVFMKGANYIPADSFLNRVSTETHKQYFDATVYANMNTLRVWGGGVYQDDEFYQMADERGIMIWQDFMFACSLYPGDEAFMANVGKEAEYNVVRLRNHPCIVIWCGNNEIEMGIECWNWPEKFNYSDALYHQLKQDYMHLFDKRLPEVLKKYDPKRHYLRSSPIGFWERQEEQNKGNHHYWGVWHGKEPFSEYQRRIPRFMSEYGFQSFPMPASVELYTEADDWQLESPVMKVHQKHAHGNKLIRSYMEKEFNKPKDFNSLLYVSQVQQAMGLKLAFEAHRAAMPYCMGSLYWQLNDTWPATSWSGIDYFGRWKALHYQARRSFAEQLMVVTQTDDMTNVTLVSDSWTSFQATLVISLIDLKGSLLWEYADSFEAQPMTSEKIFEIQSLDLLKGCSTKDAMFLARLYSDAGQLISENNYIFSPHRDLVLQESKVTLTKTIGHESILLELETDVVVRHLYISIPDTKENLSDNFFDLIPGSTKQVSLNLPDLDQPEIEKIAEQITCFSLVDSYEFDVLPTYISQLMPSAFIKK